MAPACCQEAHENFCKGPQTCANRSIPLSVNPLQAFSFSFCSCWHRCPITQSASSSILSCFRSHFRVSLVTALAMPAEPAQSQAKLAGRAGRAWPSTLCHLLDTSENRLLSAGSNRMGILLTRVSSCSPKSPMLLAAKIAVM